MSWIQGARTRLRLLFGSAGAESRMEEEIRFHIEMETERLIREEGLDPVEARRRAFVAFGGVDRTREDMREGRGFAWLSGLRLDLKLGLRMLAKYPVLTGASVLSLAIAVALAASWFQFMTNIVRPVLPIPANEDVVMVRTRDQAAAANRPTTLHDFEDWQAVSTLVDLSASTPVEYTVTTEAGRFGALQGVRVTPSLLPMTRVRPLAGRWLTSADYEASAPLTAVLGAAAAEALFGQPAAAVGETLRLGAEHATVVGVMPEGFGYPMNEEIWTPLRENVLAHERGDGPLLLVTGRLAPGASIEEARAELSVIGERNAAAYPETHEHLRPDVRRFGRGSDMAGPAALLNVPFMLFLLVVSANVATLFFARTASRESEIALRSALGAGRRRLVLQLVAEALVLTAVAAGLGIAMAHWGLGWGMDLFWEVQQESPPFWFRSGISVPTALYALLLAGLGALVIGGVPGLRATRRHLRSRLPQPGATGGGMRFGVAATGVIIVQVALCVAFIPIALMNGRVLLPDQNAADFPAEAWLSGRLTHAERDPGPATGALFDEVERRLAAEPGILAATRVSRIPGFNHPMDAIEVDGDSSRIVEARSLAVDPDYFGLMDARIVAGRGLTEADVTGEVDVVVLDRAWADAAFEGRNPIGRRIRYADRPADQENKWFEVVGLVENLDRAHGPGEFVRVFHPLRPDEMTAVQLYLRTAPPTASHVPRVVDLVAAVDQNLALLALKPLDEIWRPVLRSNTFFVAALGVVAAIILLFAMIGIYALMSFTVTRRAREIGIRTALGAEPRRIVVSIFARAMAQIGLGVAVGAVLISALVASDPGGIPIVAGVAAAMMLVGMAGCVLPARRALRIQPTEALRAE